MWCARGNVDWVIGDAGDPTATEGAVDTVFCTAATILFVFGLFSGGAELFACRGKHLCRIICRIR